VIKAQGDALLGSLRLVSESARLSAKGSIPTLRRCRMSK
jgi:hypothetical protein